MQTIVLDMEEDSNRHQCPGDTRGEDSILDCISPSSSAKEIKKEKKERETKKRKKDENHLNVYSTQVCLIRSMVKRHLGLADELQKGTFMAVACNENLACVMKLFLSLSCGSENWVMS